MAKNRVPAPVHQIQNPPMPSPHSYTVDHAAGDNPPEDDEADICPVCDGVCTCGNNNPSSQPTYDPPQPPTESRTQPNVSPSVPTPAPSVSSTPTRASSTPTNTKLKIRLTLPPNPAGRKASSAISSSADTPMHDESVPGPSNSQEEGPSSTVASVPKFPYYHPVLNPTGPKRRGRPPKAVVAAREAAARALVEAQEASGVDGQDIPYSLLARPSSTKKKSTKSGGVTKARKGKVTTPTTTNKKKKQSAAVRRGVGRPSAATTSRRPGAKKRSAAYQDDTTSVADSSRSDYDFDDAASGQFPTFVSAMSTSSDDSDDSSDSSCSGFDSDSSMEAEEEQYILSEERQAHDKVRVRRELLGEENLRKQHRKNWVIQPRQKSVGASDVEMDADSDATEEAEHIQETEELEEEDEDETDGMWGRSSYHGLVTGWWEDSDDEEESNFDAELFFANLSDSEKDGSSDDSSSSGAEEGEDGDQSDLDDAMSVDGPTEGPLLPAFEVAERWDGQVVFTNGLQDSHVVPSHLDFGLDAAPVDPSPSPSQSGTMDSFTDGEEEGYEQDHDLVEGEGSTTDEELIGEDNLPNERAMSLFNFPPSVSAINPLSTMSPGRPSASTTPSSRRRKRSSSASLDSPKPADILSGRFQSSWDSEDEDDHEDRFPSRRSSFSKGGVPRRGEFSVEGIQKHRHAVIQSSRRSLDVPSPHARARVGRGRGRGSSSASLGRHDELQRLLTRTPYHRPSSMPALDRTPYELQTPISGGDMMSPLPPSSSIPEVASPIELDDMIDSSFLSTETANEHDSHSKGRNRWDRFSVGAFRQSGLVDRASSGWMSESTSTAGGGSDTGSTTDFGGGMIKSGPLSTMLWPNSRPRSSSMVVSPGLWPVPEGEGFTVVAGGGGDRTPTATAAPHTHRAMSVPTTPEKQSSSSTSSSKGKHGKKERKTKRKTGTSSVHSSPVPYSRPKHSPAHHHHHRQHHPNSKLRGASGSQRASSSAPTLSI